jgi:tight adherence protein B
MLILILIPLFVFFIYLYYLAIKYLQLRADVLVKEAEANIDELFMKFQAKRILYLTILLVVLLAFFGLIFTRSIIFSAILAVTGYFVPKLYFRFQQKRRLDALNLQLIIAIEMMGNALRSGSNLPQAIMLIQREMGPPISQEFGMMVKEMAVGVRLEDTLDHLAKRVKSEEFNIVVTAKTIARDTGGNLAEVYERISKTIRDRNEMLGKIKSLTAEGKMQGILIGLLPFILAGALTLIDPQMMRPMYTTLIGNALIGVVIIMELIGYYFIRKLINIDV